MNKIKLIASFLLFVPILSSCEFDEESDLLFQLKDTLQAAGVWETSGGKIEKFEFLSDGTFTARINGKRGSGTFVYSLNEDKYTWTTNKQIATFTLTWNSSSTITTPPTTLQVREKPNGDRYFESSGKLFTQIS